MKRIKLFEAYNRNETLLGLAKMGLRTNRKEVFDLAVSRGFDVKDNFNNLRIYCENIANFNSIEWIYPNKEVYQEYIDGITFFNCANNNLTSLKGIERLTNLTKLRCYNNNLTDLKGIEGLTKLRNLQCNENNLTSLKGIENLTRLTTLYCNDNQLTDLKGIKKLTNLFDLNCAHNNISSLKGIEGLTNLGDLNCPDNKISSLKGIENLTKLLMLDCRDNPLPQEVLDIDYRGRSSVGYIEEIKDYYRENE